MKRLFFFIFTFSFLVGNAQNIDKVKLRVHYTTKFKHFETSPQKTIDEKILDVGDYLSKFYSLWETRIEEVTDSVIAHGGAMQDVMNARGKLPYPRSYDYYIIYKNYPQKGKLTGTDKDLKHYIYEEALEKQNWTILLEDSIVAGYQCQKARAQFRGRVWDVWFAPGIPVSDGPWKLCGLPGLILYAKDSKDDFLFECIEIKEGRNEDITFPKRKYIKSTQAELNQMKINIAKDPAGYMKRFGSDFGRGWGPDGKPLVHKEKKAVLLEY